MRQAKFWVTLGCASHVLIGAAWTSRALAADVLWASPAGGSFGEPANWSGGLVPGSEDNAVFSTGSPAYTVTLDAGRSINTLFVQNDSVALDLGGFQFLPAQISLQESQQSYLSISNGTLGTLESPSSLLFRVIFDPGGSATDSREVVIQGPETSTTFNSILTETVGSSTLRLLDGSLTHVTTRPSITLIGSSEANALLEVNSGATLAADNSIRIGSPSLGNGEMLIAGGGQVTSQDAPSNSAGVVGYGHEFQTSIAHVSVSDSGSSWIMDGRLTLGNRYAVGTIDVLAGGYMQSTTGRIAREATTEGHLVINGAGSEYHVNEQLFVGGSETAPGGVGTVLVEDGGRLSVGQRLHVWNTGTVSVDSSSFAIVGDAQAIAGAVSVGPDGSLTGDGTILADVFSSGELSPGNSAGLLTVFGDLSQASEGELLIELGGTGPGLFDVLSVDGLVTLDGTLRVSAIEGFVASPGDTFEFLFAEGISGSFPSFVDETGFGLLLELDGGTGTLTATVPEPATLVLLVGAALLAARRRRLTAVCSRRV